MEADQRPEEVRRDIAEAPSPLGNERSPDVSRELIVATILPRDGITGVHTHFHQLLHYLDDHGRPATLITPFAGFRLLVWPLFGLRLLIQPFSGPAGVWWYRHWHEALLHRALRRHLARVGECVVYAQCPLSARAALRARRGPYQRVVMAVHFRISQSDEWEGKQLIQRDGRLFRAIRTLEAEVIPRVDGLVYVSAWARHALASWFPAPITVRSAVIHNFVAPRVTVGTFDGDVAELVTVGNLDVVKNHRYMLQVLAAANRAGRRFTLDVYGEGSQRSNLVRLIDELGLQRQVRLLGFRSDVRDALPGYRGYIHASYSESSSLAIIEAMAAGLPIVAGDIGPLRELLDDGVEGRFWPLDDPERAAEILIGLVDFEPERARAAQAASARFRRDFHADGIAPALLSFLTQDESMAAPGSRS